VAFLPSVAQQIGITLTQNVRVSRSTFPLNQNSVKAIKHMEIDMAGNDTLTFTDATFDTDVINSEVPVLVDFWAEWCGPCRMMGPTVDQVATEYSGKVKVGKLDVDSNQQTAARYGIRGIPTLLLFKDGKIVEQKVGAIGKPEFQKMLEKHLQPA
jgi:thioredoxin 1